MTIITMIAIMIMLMLMAMTLTMTMTIIMTMIIMMMIMIILIVIIIITKMTTTTTTIHASPGHQYSWYWLRRIFDEIIFQLSVSYQCGGMVNMIHVATRTIWPAFCRHFRINFLDKNVWIWSKISTRLIHANSIKSVSVQAIACRLFSTES